MSKAAPKQQEQVNTSNILDGLLNDSSVNNDGEGYFAENYRNLVKSQREIEEVVELLNRD